MPPKNFIFFLCMYKMGQISKEGYKKCEADITDKGTYFLVNRKDLEVESHVANWAQIFDKCDQEKQKYRQELTPNAEYQRCRVFVRNDLVKRKIKSCRKSSKKFLEFKEKVRIRPWRSYLWRTRHHKRRPGCIWRRNNTYSVLY